MSLHRPYLFFETYYVRIRLDGDYMKRTQDIDVQSIYKKIIEDNPEIKDESQIELLVREYIMKKKMIKAAKTLFLGFLIIFGISFLGGCLERFEYMFDHLTESIISCCLSVLGMIGSGMIILGVCKFAKVLHNPLTPNESKEFAEKDAMEKRK